MIRTLRALRPVLYDKLCTIGDCVPLRGMETTSDISRRMHKTRQRRQVRDSATPAALEDIPQLKGKWRA